MGEQQEDRSMRELFRGYYRPSQATTKAIWADGLVVFDTNVLLDLYRYSAATRDALLGVMTRLREQLWLPHQVAQEYQERRLDVVRQQDEVADNLRRAVQQAEKNVRAHCEGLTEHPYLERTSLLKAVESGFNAIAAQVTKPGGKAGSWDPIEDDDIRKRLDQLFEDRVGAPFEPDDLRDVVREGEERYAASVPPGFQDAEKEGDRKYGDLILWLQIVAKARSVSKPVIFITNDGKSDWWWMHGSGRVGPHPKLVEELHAKAGTDMLMYTPDRFTAHASRILKADVSKSRIDEIATVADRLADRSLRGWHEVLLPVEILVEAAEHELLRLRQKRNGHVGYRAGLKSRLMEPLSADELNEIQVSLHDQEQRIQALSNEIAELEDAASALMTAEPHSSRSRRAQAFLSEFLAASADTALGERFGAPSWSHYVMNRVGDLARSRGPESDEAE